MGTGGGGPEGVGGVTPSLCQPSAWQEGAADERTSLPLGGVLIKEWLYATAENNQENTLKGKNQRQAHGGLMASVWRGRGGRGGRVCVFVCVCVGGFLEMSSNVCECPVNRLGMRPGAGLSHNNPGTHGRNQDQRSEYHG